MAYKRRRRGKRDRLQDDGFTRHEANELSQMPFSKMPYIRTMRNHRKRLLAGIETEKEAHALIRKDYRDNDWRDIFSMMRDFRGKAIDRGYKPILWKASKDYHRTHKGDVVKQRARYKAEQERKKETKKRGAVSAMYDLDGKRIGEIVQNPDTGRFEVR